MCIVIKSQGKLTEIIHLCVQPWKSGIHALFVFGLFVNTCNICFVDLTPVPAAFVIEDHAEIIRGE